jgi:hypothetical protein
MTSMRTSSCRAVIRVRCRKVVIVTGSADETARLWLFQVNDLMNLARITVGRNFSVDEWRLYFPSEKYRKTFDELPGPDESVTQKNN